MQCLMENNCRLRCGYVIVMPTQKGGLFITKRNKAPHTDRCCYDERLFNSSSALLLFPSCSTIYSFHVDFATRSYQALRIAVGSPTDAKPHCSLIILSSKTAALLFSL